MSASYPQLVTGDIRSVISLASRQTEIILIPELCVCVCVCVWVGVGVRVCVCARARVCMYERVWAQSTHSLGHLNIYPKRYQELFDCDERLHP